MPKKHGSKQHLRHLCVCARVRYTTCIFLFVTSEAFQFRINRTSPPRRRGLSPTAQKCAAIATAARAAGWWPGSRPALGSKLPSGVLTPPPPTKSSAPQLPMPALPKAAPRAAHAPAENLGPRNGVHRRREGRLSPAAKGQQHPPGYEAK